MAFILRDLQQLATSPSGITAWAYRTADSAADVLAKGYFDGAASLMRAGDRIAVFATGGKANTHMDMGVDLAGKATVRVALLASAPPVR